jgi:hypothetical protein
MYDSLRIQALQDAVPHWLELANRFERDHPEPAEATHEARILAKGRLQLLLEEGRAGIQRLFTLDDLLVLSLRQVGNFSKPDGSFEDRAAYVGKRDTVDGELSAKYESLTFAQRFALDDLIQQAWYCEVEGVERFQLVADRLRVALAQ